MKELFQKLSNIFSFGKENRLVNEGGETQQPAPDTVQEGQVEAVDTYQSPDDKRNAAKDKGDVATEASDKQISSLKAHERSATSEIADANTINPHTSDIEIKPKIKNAETSLLAKKPGVKDFFNAMGSEKMSNVFSVNSTSSAEAEAKAIATKELEEGFDLGKPTVVAGADTEKFEGIDLSGKSKKGEVLDGELKELSKDAHEAGARAEEEMVATRELEKGFDLGYKPTAIADAGGKKEDIDFNTMPPMNITDGEDDTQQASLPIKAPRP